MYIYVSISSMLLLFKVFFWFYGVQVKISVSCLSSSLVQDDQTWFSWHVDKQVTNQDQSDPSQLTDLFSVTNMFNLEYIVWSYASFIFMVFFYFVCKIKTAVKIALLTVCESCKIKREDVGNKKTTTLN